MKPFCLKKIIGDVFFVWYIVIVSCSLVLLQTKLNSQAAYCLLVKVTIVFIFVGKW